MSARQPFEPHYGAGVTVAMTTVSQSVAFGRDNKSASFENNSTAICYISMTFGARTASQADHQLLPNSQVVLSKPNDADTLNVIGTVVGNLHAIPGEGW
jgi:hypothetical protein